ncbi:venom allergen 5-like [Odontomachus brunneus]|uniref:venom allergen 5-like n=1 Tax=Odontomachus brunneus TaxID=486640 RepID=UPI0013F2615D|nr:venom allergen 5-like [Odontomachus brunneus]
MSHRGISPRYKSSYVVQAMYLCALEDIPKFEEDPRILLLQANPRGTGDCVDAKNDDLDEGDIETVVDAHNFDRVVIANGEKSRGNPGPQPAVRTMMELIWDDELAVIARRWALQCKLFLKDQCRDVGAKRFGVWQNVNVLDMDSVESGTERIHFHIAS